MSEPGSVVVFTRTPAGKEQLAARALGGEHYVITSIPFLDVELALGDIVSCRVVDGDLHVDAVSVRGGNSTLRVLPHGVDVVSPLLGLGARLEQGPAGLVAVSLGPEAPAEGISAWLEGLADEGLIDLAPGYTAGD